MRPLALKTIGLLIASLLVAMMLTVAPLPTWANWLRPLWVVMVVIYWVYRMPYMINVGMAWILGLLLDVLYDAILGEHALALVVVAYVITELRSKMQFFSLWQQTGCILLALFIYQTTVFFLEGVLGHAPTTWWYWLPCLTSALFWPWVFIILQSCEHRVGNT